MDDQLLFHDDATALMAGSLPQDRPDLVVLAAAIHGYRDAYVAPAPQASPELMGWLSGTPTPPRNDTEVLTAATPVRTRANYSRWRRTAASASTGWGVTAQIALGGTAALATVATAGAVGVLPDGPQMVFDRILDTNRTEAPPPNSPVDETDIEAPLAPGPGEQRLTEPRSPSQDTPARQDPESGNTSQDTTGDRPRGERETAPSSDESDESDNETKKDPDDRSDDRPGKDDSQTDDKEEQDDNRAGAEEEQDDRRADDAGDLSDRTEDADEVTTVDGDVD